MVYYNEDKERQIEDWILSRVGKEKFKVGALRLRRVLKDHLDAIKKRDHFITTVGGTNGKGETVYTLSHLLQQDKIKHVQWISPHVLSIGERISSNGIPIDYDILFSLLKEEYERIIKAKESVSFYELLLSVFLAFLRGHQKSDIDVILLEVGLGGRLDGVNLLDPNLTAVTSISRDHQEILGNRYDLILMEKLGICRPRTPLVTSLELKYCQDLVEKFCLKKRVPWIDLFKHQGLSKESTFSKRNQLLAINLKEFITNKLGIPPTLATTIPSFPGRGENLNFREANFTFFGSHNIDGVRKFILKLEQDKISEDKKFDLLLIALSKRSFEEEPFLMLKIFLSGVAKGLYKKIIFTEFTHMKALKISDDFLEKFTQNGENKEETLSKLEWIKEWQKWIVSEELQGQKILVSGSYYFAGLVQSFLKREQRSMGE